MMRFASVAQLGALTLGMLLSSFAVAEEWPYWRGPRFDSTSAEQNLPETWDPKGGEGSNVLWTAEIGSRSTPTLMNGKLYLLTTDNPDDEAKAGEKVVCLDALTGSTVWEYGFNVYLSDVPIERVGWSSVTCDPETGNVYAQGVCGYFCCLNGENGNVLWEHSLHEEYGFLTTYGGRTNFPIIHENNVIVSAVVIGWGDMAKPAHRFIAFDKTNGQPVWFNGTTLLPHDTTYSAPVLAVIDGELQMIFASGDGGVHGFQPRTGKHLWKYMISGRGINTSPLVVGNRVYCGHSEENVDSTEMGAVFCLDATKRGDITKTGEIWRTKEIFAGRSSPMMIEGRLYVADDRGKMHCLDAETGKPLGDATRLGTMMRANLLYADGKIYAHEANGRGYVLKPTEDGAEYLHKFRFPRGEEAHGSPIAWNARVYIPTTGKMYCIGKEGAEQSLAEVEAAPQETPPGDEDKPAQVQVVPVESLLRPGTRQPMAVRLYNERGQYLRNAKMDEIEMNLEGPGEIDDQGRYTILHDQKDQAPAYITAKMGELTGDARIRIVPDLGWSFNFDAGVVPITWVGARYRHITLDWDLLSKLRSEDQLTGDLYIYTTTEFTNFAPKREFDDSTPRQTWTNLLRYLGYATGEKKPKNVEEAKKLLDPALNRLKEEKVIATAEWSTWDRPTGQGDENVPEPRLTITQGERRVDGNGVMCKIKTIPLGARSQGWMGHSDLHDYTIQADVLGFERAGKLPDIGLVAQRYTLDMMGASKKMQIRTWTPQLNRLSFEAPIEWEPNTWYTLKFHTGVEDGKAVLKGKFWKKGEPEPEAWTVEGVDEEPNVQGSPGLFGNAKDAEIFYDNLTVTPNK